MRTFHGECVNEEVFGPKMSIIVDLSVSGSYNLFKVNNLLKALHNHMLLFYCT